MYISHPYSQVPDEAIFITIEAAVDLTDVMTSANSFCNRLTIRHSAVVYTICRFPTTSMIGLTTGKHYHAAVITLISGHDHESSLSISQFATSRINTLSGKTTFSGPRCPNDAQARYSQSHGQLIDYHCAMKPDCNFLLGS